MLVGVAAEPLLLPTVTTTPPGPAGLANVTVPVEVLPPVTGFGFKFKLMIVPWLGPAGVITSGAVAVLLDVALMFAVV